MRKGQQRSKWLKWNELLRKNTGLGPYVWIVFYILPFYFIFRSSAPVQIAVGVAMVILFFVCYQLAFVSKGRLVYVWSGMLVVLSTAMGFLFGYIYFSLFLAYLIGHLRHRAAFFTMYSIHLVGTLAAVNYSFAKLDPDWIKQLPFVLICLIAVILLPMSTYNKNKEDRLLGQLEDANKRIGELLKQEERQRIARDLHDTLGQKLSLIGLKSELALKLIGNDPERAKAEMRDVRDTARSALKEVRQLVSRMRGTRLPEELARVRQMLNAAHIELVVKGDPELAYTSSFNENVVCMCLREAVNNLVKHSGADRCEIAIEESREALVVRITDNGSGFDFATAHVRGSGLKGMKERLEFINGSIRIGAGDSGGTSVLLRVPHVKKPVWEQEGNP